MGGPGRLQHLLVGGTPAAQADVFHHRVPEQHHILKHHGVGAQEGLWVHRGHVRPTQGHLPAGDVPEPGGQLAGGGLPAAGGTDEGGDLPLAGGETHILQHSSALPVGKGDMVKGDVVAGRAEVLLPRLHRLFQNGAHPFDLQLGVEGGGDVLEHHTQRIVQPGSGKQEAQEIEERELPGQQQRPAGEHRGSKPQPQKGLGGAHKHAGSQLGPDGAALHGGQLCLQVAQVPLLPVAGLDVSDGLQTLLDAVGHCPFVQNIIRPEGVLDLLTSRCQRHRHGHHPQHRERHAPVAGKHTPPDHQRGADRGKQLGHIVGEHLVQAGAVGNHGGGQVAEITVPEKGQGKPAQGLCQAHPTVSALPVGGDV